MTLGKLGDATQNHFGAQQFRLAAAFMIDGPERFAAMLGARYLRARAHFLPPEQVYLSADQVSNFSRHIHMNLTVGRAGQSRQQVAGRTKLEIHHDHSRSEIIRQLQTFSPISAIVEPRLLYRQLAERFKRVERAVKTEPSERNDSTGSTSLSRKDPAPTTPVMQHIHHRAAPRETQVQIPEIRRELARNATACSEHPPISAKELSRVADEVITVLNRQSLAWRERLGRV